MKSYVVEGGNKLTGEVKISGSKNASLPIIAATILNSNISKLYNVPNIKDTRVTLKILSLLGCKIKKNSGKIEINSKNITEKQIPESLMREARSTIILAGAILGRFKQVRFSYPGGCDIGSRPIDLHINSLKKLGIQVEEKAGEIECKCEKIIGSDINLDFPSVGATENIILAATCAEGTTTITNAAMEPEIIDLVEFLNKMGAKITGAGTNEIKIIGVKKLKPVSYRIMPDRIEAGTFLCMIAGTGGKAKILNANSDHIVPVMDKLKEAGCKFNINKSYIEIDAPKKLKSLEIKTMPHPGFPTDLQPIFGAMLANAKGTSIIIENIFENRYRYMGELKKMGAKITIEGKTAVIKGARKLNSACVECQDLRGGAALVLAAICARGTSVIRNMDYILRGYEDLDKKLVKLGANIYLKEGECINEQNEKKEIS